MSLPTQSVQTIAMAIPLLFLLLSLSPETYAAAAGGGCSAQIFTNGRSFAECNDLPQLSASLHFTYDRTSGELSLAFLAPPAAPAGWVAWAINPSGEGMVGAQALVAFKQPNGSMGVKTYNITEYGPIKESPILYNTSDLAAEYGSDGKMTLFAKVLVGKGLKTLNQVWQVGSSVTKGVPDKHAFGNDNLASKGKLDLTNGGSASSPSASPAPAPLAAGPAPLAAGPEEAGSCSAETFPNRVFQYCNDLPHLLASLHYTYDRTSGDLSLAFVAPPAAPAGWVAWAINPSGEGMIGAQALIAFKQQNGSIGVKTYNISEYGPIKESPILYKTSDLAAEYGSDGKINLFAKVSVGKEVESLNHVWQVGSSVSNGVPNKHAFGTDNLASKGKLDLVTGVIMESPAPAPVPETTTVAAAPGSPAKSVASRRWSVSGFLSVIITLFLGEVLIGFRMGL